MAQSLDEWLKKNKGKIDAGKNIADTFAKNTPGSVHRTAEYNKNIEPTAGATENPWEVTGEYVSNIKTGQGQQTTLLRDIEKETKKKGNTTG